MNIDLHRAEALLRTEGLSFPALPTELATQLLERRTGVYSTRELIIPPYTLEGYVTELLRSSNPSDYAVLAIDGHGVQSWAFHYYLVSGPLAMFIQLPWSGAYTDEATARVKIEHALAWAKRLPERLAELKKQGRLSPEQKLLVVLTQLSKSRWAWVQPPETAEIAWRSAKNMLSDINAELTALLEGQRK